MASDREIIERILRGIVSEQGETLRGVPGEGFLDILEGGVPPSRPVCERPDNLKSVGPQASGQVEPPKNNKKK